VKGPEGLKMLKRPGEVKGVREMKGMKGAEGMK
jgi:hypothetical protein